MSKPTSKKAAPPEISTTAAAILGLVAVQRGSAYELAQRMKTSHHFIWPRAESKLYEEVKRLAAQGLVAASDQGTGRRPRTEYSILPLGVRALGEWVKRPSEPPLLSFEALVKLAYSDFGSIEDARAQVRSVGEQAAQWMTLGRTLADLTMRGDVALPQRAHTNVVIWRFLAGYCAALADWAIVADEALSHWDGVHASKRNAEVTKRLFQDGLRLFDAIDARAKPRRRP